MSTWSSPTGYVFRPEDPRAPTSAEWEAMTAEERKRVLDTLPSEIPRATPPEGDFHFKAKTRALEALGEFFRQMDRRIYLASEIPVYYPGEPMFAADIIAVLDVSDHDRMKWMVADEGRGLDLAIEITVGGDAKKDFEGNVTKFARLGIPEYFAFHRGTGRLVGYRLEGKATYSPILPQAGRWASKVLGLSLGVESTQLRFYSGTAPLPFAAEIIAKLGAMANELVEHKEAAEAAADVERGRAEEAIVRAEQERARAEQERARAEQERARADALAERLRALGVDPEGVDR